MFQRTTKRLEALSKPFRRHVQDKKPAAFKTNPKLERLAKPVVREQGLYKEELGKGAAWRAARLKAKGITPEAPRPEKPKYVSPMAAEYQQEKPKKKKAQAHVAWDSAQAKQDTAGEAQAGGSVAAPAGDGTQAEGEGEGGIWSGASLPKAVSMGATEEGHGSLPAAQSMGSNGEHGPEPAGGERLSTPKLELLKTMQSFKVWHHLLPFCQGSPCGGNVRRRCLRMMEAEWGGGGGICV